jgi:hypothetical protein
MDGAAQRWALPEVFGSIMKMKRKALSILEYYSQLVSCDGCECCCDSAKDIYLICCSRRFLGNSVAREDKEFLKILLERANYVTGFTFSLFYFWPVNSSEKRKSQLSRQHRINSWRLDVNIRSRRGHMPTIALNALPGHI